ncbi:MAG TPA: VTT domain-containing protein [Phycisphaerae bacterium]|nr:VTT domain-containing protein [Phycisphaerae bacterium]
MPPIDPLSANHGLLLFAAILLAGAGAPIPLAPILLAIGAMAAAGHINPAVAFLLPALCLVPGDALWFLLGRRFGQGILHIVCKFTFERDTCIRSTQDRFARYGLRTLLIARFVPGLSTLASPMAGAALNPFQRFLPYEFAGALLYSAAYLLLGFLFSNQLGTMVQVLEDAGIRLTVAAIILVLLYAGSKLAMRWWLIRQMHSISIEAASIPKDPDHEPLIVDLRGRNDLTADPHIIPGAHRWKMDELLNAAKSLPRDTLIVLICACPNDATSTRAALSLRAKGFPKARPLRGGLHSWRAAGLPLQPATPPTPALIPA